MVFHCSIVALINKGDKVIHYYQKSEIFKQKSIKKITIMIKYAQRMVFSVPLREKMNDYSIFAKVNFVQNSFIQNSFIEQRTTNRRCHVPRRCFQQVVGY